MRFDLLTREWVNIVGHRQDRPNLPDAGCPFCVGGLEAPDPYDVRWFPNRWPAFSPGPPVAFDEATPTVPAVGACEVVLFSPDHDQSLATLPAAQIRKVIDLWADRTDELLSRPEIEYALVFENRGREVGATIDHPHGQIYGYPLVPPAPAAEVRNGAGCPVCREVEREVSAKERIVAESGDWVAWVPFASGYAYGVRIAPRAHVGSLPALDAAARDDLAAILIDVLGRYDRLWQAPHAGYRFPYLLWFHQAPAGASSRADVDGWHVHVHVAPPLRAPGVLRYVASGELGSGTLSNPVVPEDAARALRDA
jgi:UDPglucose--hexose-1-phosphate uridylyltransferase